MKRRVWIAAVASLVAASGMAHADQVADIQKKGELVVGVLGTDEPNSFIDPKTRELVGYDVDLGKAVAQKIGVKPVFKQLTVAARIPRAVIATCVAPTMTRVPPAAPARAAGWQSSAADRV